jgi:hypothetical protein
MWQASTALQQQPSSQHQENYEQKRKESRIPDAIPARRNGIRLQNDDYGFAYFCVAARSR